MQDPFKGPFDRKAGQDWLLVAFDFKSGVKNFAAFIEEIRKVANWHGLRTEAVFIDSDEHGLEEMTAERRKDA